MIDGRRTGLEPRMKDAKDVIPWKVTDISIRPYEGYWSMNPSIHFDGQTWRCVLRCCDYAMPDGVTVRSKNARSVGQQTKNAMVLFNPATWRPIEIFKMHEKDDLPREACPHVGYEDMRIFWTNKGGLQGIAASLHLRRDREQRATDKDRPQHQPPEQVLVSFDAQYNIVAAQPIRGDGWSGTPQKNWVPFDACAEPRFLHSIAKGSMYDARGPVHGEAARARPSTKGQPVSHTAAATTAATAPISHADPEVMTAADKASQDHDRSKAPKRQVPVRGGDVRIVRGGRLQLDAMTSRPSSRQAPRGSPRSAPARTGDEATRLMGSGRILLPRYEGLRGGSQLVQIADDAWIALAHEMKFVSGRKYYWHTWYAVDGLGKMRAVSEPMKLAENGIEFAAGLAITGDRVVVSFGVDDMNCRIGETSLAAVMATLQPIERGSRGDRTVRSAEP